MITIQIDIGTNSKGDTFFDAKPTVVENITEQEIIFSNLIRELMLKGMGELIRKSGSGEIIESSHVTDVVEKIMNQRRQ
jgi:hypothetical protein